MGVWLGECGPCSIRKEILRFGRRLALDTLALWPFPGLEGSPTAPPPPSLKNRPLSIGGWGVLGGRTLALRAKGPGLHLQDHKKLKLKPILLLNLHHLLYFFLAPHQPTLIATF